MPVDKERCPQLDEALLLIPTDALEAGSGSHIDFDACQKRHDGRRPQHVVLDDVNHATDLAGRLNRLDMRARTAVVRDGIEEPADAAVALLEADARNLGLEFGAAADGAVQVDVESVHKDIPHRFRVLPTGNNRR